MCFRSSRTNRRNASPLQLVIGLLLRLPSSKLKIATELGEARRGLEAKLVPHTLPTGSSYHNALPKEGKTPEWLKEEMDRLLSMEKGDVKEGRVSGAVYHVSCMRLGMMKLTWLMTVCRCLSLSAREELTSTRSSWMRCPSSSYQTLCTRMSSQVSSIIQMQDLKSSPLTRIT